MKHGTAPQHLVSWAPNDWLTSRTRARSAMTGDAMLRTVYFELINVLYANGGELPSDARGLSDLLLLPVGEIERTLPILCEIGSIEVDGGVLRQPRVSRELQRCQELTSKRRAAARTRWDASGMQTDADEKSALQGALAIGSGSGSGSGEKEHKAARDVFAHWTERAHTKPKSSKVEASVLKRIDARLRDGFTPDDLKRCVDVACADEFYVQRGYYKQPDVIFRNAERVQSLLARREHAAARPLPL